MQNPIELSVFVVTRIGTRDSTYGDRHRKHRLSDLRNFAGHDLHRLRRLVVSYNHPLIEITINDMEHRDVPNCPLFVPHVKTSLAVQQAEAVLQAATPMTYLALSGPVILRAVY